MIAILWRRPEGSLLPAVGGTHLHAIEGSNTHVEEDAIEHRHGNELQGEEQEKLSEQPPHNQCTVNTWRDIFPRLLSTPIAPTSGQCGVIK